MVEDIQTFTFPMNVEMKLSAQDIVEGIPLLQIVELIKAIESECPGWEVAALLSRHFNDLLHDAIIDNPNLFDASDEELTLELERHELERLGETQQE